jgi:hypothetical protein
MNRCEARDLVRGEELDWRKMEVADVSENVDSQNCQDRPVVSSKQVDT